MKKASNLRLSLRKLLVATLAVGPLAVLPAPLMAALPAIPAAPGGGVATGVTVISGTAPYTNVAGVGTFSVSDKAVLNWGTQAFGIGAAETLTFTFTGNATQAAAKSVLNRVGYNNDGTIGAATDFARIAGSLTSNGNVYLLVNGAVYIEGGATINAPSLFISTLAGEPAGDTYFLANGTLQATGASTGTANLGSVGLGAFDPSGAADFLTPGAFDLKATTNLTVYAGDIAVAGGSAAGTFGNNVYLKSTTGNAAMNMAALAAQNVSGNLTVITNQGNVNLAVNAGGLNVSGDLAVTTNGGDVTQTNRVLVGTTGGTSVGTAVATLNVGPAAVTLTNAANSFQTISVTNSGANDVKINDANVVRLGTSSIGRDLFVNAAGAVAGVTDAITTNGTVTVGRDAQFTLAGAGARSNINIGNSISVTGNVTLAYASVDAALAITGAAANANSGSITYNAGSNPVNVGIISNGSGALTGGATSITSTGAVVLNNAITTGPNGNVGGGLNITGASITSANAGTITAVSDSAISLTATNGGITLGKAVTVTPAAAGIGGGLTISATGGNISTGGAAEGIAVTGNVTTSITGVATVASPATGHVTIGAGGLSTTATGLLGGSLTITGANITSNGAILTTGNGTTSLIANGDSAADRGVVALTAGITTLPSTPGFGGGLTITGSAISTGAFAPISVTGNGTATLTTSGNSTQTNANGNISLVGSVTTVASNFIGGGLAITSSQNVTAAAATGTISATSATPVSISATGNATFNAAVTVTPAIAGTGGSITVTGNNINTGAGAISVTGNATSTLTATNNVTLGAGGLTTAQSNGLGGSLTVSGKFIDASAGAITTTGNGTTSLTASNATGDALKVNAITTNPIPAGPATAGEGGNLSLRASRIVLSGAIGITGNGTSTINSTGSANDLSFGANAVAITVAPSIAGGNGGNLSLISSRDITTNASGTQFLTATSSAPVSMTATGNITIDRPVTIGATSAGVGGSLAMSANQISTGGAFIVGGNATNTLTASAGDVTIGGAFTSTHSGGLGGSLTVSGRNITTSAALSTTGNATTSLTGTGPIAINAGITTATATGGVGGTLSISGSRVTTATGANAPISIGSNATSSITATGDVVIGFTPANAAASTITSTHSSNSGGALTISGRNITSNSAITTTGNATTSVTGTEDILIAAALTTNAAGGNGGTLSISGRDVRNTAAIAVNTANATSTINAAGNLFVDAGVSSTGTGTGANAGSLTLTASGNAAFTAAANATGGGATTGGNLVVTASRVDVENGGQLTTTGAGSRALTVTANTGNITLSGTGLITSGGNLTMNATSASINQDTGTGIVTGAAGSTISLRAANEINLARATNNLGAGSTVTVNSTTGNATIASTSATNLGTTSVPGNLTITLANADLNLGTGTSPVDASTISVAGNSTFSVGTGQVTDNNFGTVRLTGGVGLTASAVTLDGASQTVFLPITQVSLGQIQGTVTGLLSIAETTTINLGNVTAGTIYANSLQGGVVDTGLITAGNSAFEVTGSNTVVLASNAFSGSVAIRGGGNHSITGNTAAFTYGDVVIGVTRTANSTGSVTLSSSGNTSNITLGTLAAGSISVTSGGTVSTTGTQNISGNLTSSSRAGTTVNSASLTAANVTLTSGTGAAGNMALTSGLTTAGNLTITANGTVTQAAPVVVAGSTSLTTTGATGNITLATNGNDFSTVSVSASGFANITDRNSLTISGTAATSFTAAAGQGANVAGPWTLSLGNITAGTTLDLTAGNGSGTTDFNLGRSGDVSQQAGTVLSARDTSSFNAAGGNVVIDNLGNNFARVNASATGSGSITIRENSTMRVGAIDTAGNVTLTSQIGNIIEDNNAAQTTTFGATAAVGNLNLVASNGSILLDTAAIVTGSSVVNLTASAPVGSVRFRSTGASLNLGSITSNTLAVTSWGTTNLTQSAPLSVFGNTSFTARGNVTLTNTGNNFGRITIDMSNASAAKSLSLTESGTMNLGTASFVGSMTGNTTLTSVNGSIIDTGLAGLKLGGTQAGPGLGATTLRATNGSIVLDDPTTEFFTTANATTTGGVVFNAPTVTLAPYSGITLGHASATSQATTLNVTSATGSITNAGALSVSGDAFFQTQTGQAITVANVANNFGTVRFIGGAVTITEASAMDIATGSQAAGAAVLTAGGNITINNRGGVVAFDNTATLSTGTSGGTIVLPKLIRSVGQLTLTSDGAKDLSALSLLGDLNSVAPTHTGTGSYVAPSP